MTDQLDLNEGEAFDNRKQGQEDDKGEEEYKRGSSRRRGSDEEKDNSGIVVDEEQPEDEENHEEQRQDELERDNEDTELPIHKHASSAMSNEDNLLDDGGDSILQPTPRASGVQALGMNGSHAENNNNGKSGTTDNISLNDHRGKSIEVVSDEEEYLGDDNPINSNGGASNRQIGGFWGQNNNRSSGDLLVGQSTTVVASGSVIGGDNPVIISANSRAASPMDNLSEISSQLPITQPLVRSKSRSDFNTGGGAGGGAGGTGVTAPVTRYASNNPANFWKARRVLFYKNGDPFFPGVEYRFKPRDVVSIEVLLDKISPRLDLPRGARFVFGMDGDRKYSLDELEDGSSYVVSSFKTFKVSCCCCYCPFHCLPQFSRNN